MTGAKAFLRAGVKIVGLLTVIWGIAKIPHLFFLFHSLFNQPQVVPNEILSGYRFSLLFQIMIPFVLLVIGYYLLKSGDAVTELAFHHVSEEDEPRIGTLFFLLMKIAGLVMVIYAVPKVFQLAANAVFVGLMDTLTVDNKVQFIVQNLVSTVIYLLLGFYLLASGKIFYKIGFSDKNGD